MNYKKIIAIAGIVFVSFQSLFAQSSGVEMADILRENGKIYVVVGVIAIILTGVIIYLFKTEQRLNKLEKGNKS